MRIKRIHKTFATFLAVSFTFLYFLNFNGSLDINTPTASALDTPLENNIRLSHVVYDFEKQQFANKVNTGKESSDGQYLSDEEIDPGFTNRKQSYNDRQLSHDDRQQSYDDRQQSNDDRQQSYGDRQQSNDDRQLSHDDRQQSYDDRQLSHDDRQQSYDDRQQSNDDRQQSYDDRQQSYGDRQQSYNVPQQWYDNRKKLFDNQNHANNQSYQLVEHLSPSYSRESQESYVNTGRYDRLVDKSKPFKYEVIRNKTVGRLTQEDLMVSTNWIQRHKKDIFDDPDQIYVDVDTSKQCDISKILYRFQKTGEWTGLEDCDRIFYNRMPKCGSRSILNIFKWAAAKYNYTLYDAPKPYAGKRNFFVNNYDLKLFLRNMTSYPAPYLYTQHLFFVDFERFDIKSPVYINVAREPIDRYISHYYYQIYGSKGTSSANLKDNQTLEHCLVTNGEACYSILQAYIPFFCGQDKFCRKDDTSAVKRAMKMIDKYYLVVGLTEDIESFMEVLESTMPHFFEGAKQHFIEEQAALKDKFKTKKKPDVKPVAMEYLKALLGNQIKLYNYIKQKFYNLLQVVRKKNKIPSVVEYAKRFKENRSGHET